MSAVDTFAWEYLGHFAGRAVVHPLETWDNGEYVASPAVLVVGDGTGPDDADGNGRRAAATGGAMSIESWKAEFYPVPADQVPEEEAAAHGLRKYVGARPENLERHGLRQVGRDLYADDGKRVARDSLFAFDADTCALCRHHHDQDKEPRCDGCPLFELLGFDCDAENSPYQLFWGFGDAEPMIAALAAVSKRHSPVARNPPEET